MSVILKEANLVGLMIIHRQHTYTYTHFYWQPMYLINKKLVL